MTYKYMTLCSFEGQDEIDHGDEPRPEQREAALRNNRAYFDDWTPARPSTEWPSPSVSSSKPSESTGDTSGVPVVPTAEAMPREASRERGELVHMQSLSGDILGAAAASQATDSTPAPEPVDSRRKYKRVHGPFDGLRIGLLETPVQLYDLSRGGCFINSMHQQQPGVKVLLKIDLPYEGWITVRAETLDRRSEFGFAVRFTEIGAEFAAALERALVAMEHRAHEDA
jgi:hypothetical protein